MASNVVLSITLNKYSSALPGILVLLLWLLPLALLLIWALQVERQQDWLKRRLWSNPISSGLLAVIFIGSFAFASVKAAPHLWLLDRDSTPQKTPGSKLNGHSNPEQPTFNSAAADLPRAVPSLPEADGVHTKTGKQGADVGQHSAESPLRKVVPPRAPQEDGVSQTGVGNQQQIATGITQTNTGDCAQQVVNGSGNVNNCGAQEIKLSEGQLSAVQQHLESAGDLHGSVYLLYEYSALYAPDLSATVKAALEAKGVTVEVHSSMMMGSMSNVQYPGISIENLDEGNKQLASAIATAFMQAGVTKHPIPTIPSSRTSTQPAMLAIYMRK